MTLKSQLSATALLLLATSIVAPAPANADTIYDAASAFSLSNPSGPWTYGRYDVTNLPVTFVAAEIYSADVLSTPLDFWSIGPAGGFTNPSVFHNDDTNAASLSTLTVDAGGLAFHPGEFGNRAVIRFTVPTAGYYSVAAAFRGGDSSAGQTDVHVFGGLFVFDGAVTTTYNDNVTTSYSAGPSFFSIGQTIDFSVGYGNGDYSHDTTLVSASITAVPDGGSTMALLGLGLLAVEVWRRGFLISR